MVAYQNMYDSLAEFIASMDPEKVLAFHAPVDGGVEEGVIVV
jgi:hypothetical protein